jgi:hypothetical protein
MNRILLTGAGFSQNWGGWLTDEITNQLLSKINQAPDPAIAEAYLNGIAANGGNYEAILECIHRLHSDDPESQGKILRYVEDAIRGCFIEMDKLYEGKDAGLTDNATYNAEVFLAHFDAIFTTNQDGLIERLFANSFNPLGFSRTDRRNRWGVGLPGIIGMPTTHVVPNYRREITYSVLDEAFAFSSLDARYLPYVKLHGSYDWQTYVGHRLMISGGRKSQQISGSPLLSSYFNYFSEVTKRQDTHIVVIGYGFSDVHINAEIVKACETGARVSLLDPLGAQVTRFKHFTLDASLQQGAPQRDVFQALRGRLSVISQRTLKEIFEDINQAKQLFRQALNVNVG